MIYRIIILLFSVFLPYSARAELRYVAYGDLRGYLEPCGCDPATDMGGVRRIAAQLKRERLLFPDTLVFGLGNTLPVADNPLKLPYLLEAESLFQPTAVLFNVLEQRTQSVPDAVASAWGQFQRDIPYVLSNGETLKGQASGFQGRARPKRWLETKQFIVGGYVYFQGESKAATPVDTALLQRWRAELSKLDPSGKKPRLLLFAGSDADLKILLAAKLFTQVIASNKAPLDQEPSKAEHANESLLLRSADPEVLMVPLGGQGLLRGGAARFATAKPLSEVLAGGQLNHDQLGALPKATLVTWLTPGSDSADTQINDLFARYNAAASQSFVEKGKQRLAFLKDSPYVGAEACAGCHAKAYAAWQNSKHAKAMLDLKAKDKHQDQECVLCHAVAPEDNGGFVSLEHSAHLAGVQCESCHGPRRQHTQNPAAPGPSKRGLGVCAQCHNPLHSPGFEMETYWQRIQHGREG